MDRELLALLMEYLLSRQMSGFNDPGTDIPYDDYNMQGTIGGLGAVDANAYPYEDWADTGIGGAGADQFAPPMGTPAIGADGSPLYVATGMPMPRSDMRPWGQLQHLTPLMQQLENGRLAVPIQGLFGNPGPSYPLEQLIRPEPKPKPEPKPTPEPRATPTPTPTPTPAKARTVKALPKPASPMASPQASQAVRRISTAGTNAVRQPPPAAPAPKYQGPLNLLVRKTNAVRSR